MASLEASRHLSMWIDAEPDAVYAFAADPRAAALGGGLAEGIARPDVWPIADGRVSRFAPRNEFGVLDHVVGCRPARTVYNPMRVIPAGVDEPRCEVVFTAAPAARHDG